MANTDYDPAWFEATTLPELGQMVACWLERSLSGSAFHYAFPSKEVTPLVPVLAKMNRRGFVTWSSQPGSSPDSPAPDATSTWQRAMVSMYVGPTEATRIIMAARAHGFGLVVHRPEDLPDVQTYDEAFANVVLVSRGFNVYGEEPDPEDLISDGFRVGYRVVRSDIRGMGLSPTGMTALLGSVQISIYDPEWGRNDRLWPFLNEIAS